MYKYMYILCMNWRTCACVYVLCVCVHAWCVCTHVMCVCAHVLVVNETRQSKATKPENNSFFLKRKWRTASGGIWTRNVLCTRQTLYQLSHKGSSAGQAESLKFMQNKGRLSHVHMSLNSTRTCTLIVRHNYYMYLVCSFDSTAYSRGDILPLLLKLRVT